MMEQIVFDKNLYSTIKICLSIMPQEADLIREKIIVI